MEKNALMLQKNVVKNDSMCDMLRYVYIVKLQNFLNAPRMSEKAATQGRTGSLTTLATFLT